MTLNEGVTTTGANARPTHRPFGKGTFLGTRAYGTRKRCAVGRRTKKNQAFFCAYGCETDTLSKVAVFKTLFFRLHTAKPT